MISGLKKIITGLSIPQEYICTCLEDFSNPLSVTVSYTGAPEFKDVTNAHLFLGYKPLIMALIVEATDNPLQEALSICLNFHVGAFNASSIWNGFLVDKKSIARLKLKKLPQEWNLGSKRILFYEGERGEHKFLNVFNQFFNRQRDKRIKPVAGNVNLPENLYDQVRIAYSLPRIISLVSIANGDRINLFPTDLHGSVGENFYINSLRIAGKANEQVEQLNQIVISEVDTLSYSEVYDMGKNHMKDFSDRSNFNLHSERSAVFKFPLPKAILRYRELKRLYSFDQGIHRIHAYEVVSKHQFNVGQTLSHIHQYYAQWRMNNNIPTQMLLR